MSEMERNPSVSQADRSNRVLLLLEPGRDRELFAERLEAYEVLTVEPGAPLPEFDLCLVDTATYPSVEESLANLRAATRTYLPVLLVLGPDDREAVVREAAALADDVLSTPTTAPVFRSRVESLLRARRQSLELDAQRERFQSLAESAPNPIVTIDADSTVRFANAAVERVFGRDPEDVTGEPLTTLMPERFRGPHRAAMDRYLETGERQREWTGNRFTGRHADGHEVPLLVSFAEHHVAGERRFTGIMQDVTEQIRNEQDLKRTVDLLDKTQNIADVGGWENDYATGEVVWTNQTYDLLDLPREYEPELDEILELYHPEDRDAVEAAGQRALEAGEPYDLEARIVTATGRVRWVRLRGERAGDDGQVLRGTLQDITERREREQERERLVQLFEKVQDLASIGAWELDLETADITWTEETYDIYGFDPDEVEPSLELVLETCHPDDRERLERAVERSIEQGELYNIEIRVQRPDGIRRWVHVHGAPRFEDGAVVGVYGTVQDITDRKERERELERYETVLETVPEAAWILDDELRVTFANGQTVEIAGMDRDTLIGRRVGDVADSVLVDEGAVETFVDAARDVLDGGAETELTFPVEVDGEARTMELSLHPLEHDGEVEAVVGLARDITERIERQRELERTVDMLDRAEHIADVGGWQVDPETGEMLWTDQVYRIHGLDTDYEPGIEDGIEFYHPEDRPVIREAFERAVEADEPYDLELRIVRPDGEVRWVRSIGEPEEVEGRRLVRGALLDIHDRKMRERELERAIDQLEQTRDIANVSGWEYDVETEDMWWDEKVWEILGLPASFEPSSGAVLDLYEPESRAEMERLMRRAIAEFEPFDVELRLAGEPTRWVRVTGTPQVEDGEITAVQGVVRDVTKRKRRERFLRRYERIVETSSEPVYTLDGELRFTLLNDAALALADGDEPDLRGEHVATLFGEAHAEALADATTELIGHDEEQTTVETAVTDATGSERRYRTTVSLKPSTDGFRGIVCVSHEITDLIEHERRLSVLDRVIRHNLRNKMNVVLAQAASIREHAGDEALTEAAAGIEAAADELLALGEGARRFHATLDPGATEMVEPRDVAEHARHVVDEARLSYDDAVIEADIPAHAWARAHQEFELALSELVDNATTHGGDEPAVQVAVARTADEVIVRVADDGPGIPELERKALSAGLESPLQHATGLGLWFVQWTVTNSGGSMTIDDRDGGGSVVELRLPAAEPPEAA